MNDELIFEAEAFVLPVKESRDHACSCAKCQSKHAGEISVEDEGSEELFEDELDELLGLEDDETLFGEEEGGQGSALPAEKICWVQNVLNRAESENLRPDGIQGPLTRAAVQRFQKRRKLLVDGIVGKQTETALIQRALNTVARAAILPINGTMDEPTRRETRNFQTRQQLVVDGIVGPATRGAMIKALGGRCQIGVRPPPSPKTAPKRVPIDRGNCSVPANAAAETEMELELVRDELEQSSPVTVRPRVSLFLNASKSAERNHFECGAQRWALKSGSIKTPDANNCTKQVGGTPYDSGADIIRTIEAANACLERPIEAVHIFSHSGSHGIFGADPNGSIGLYSGTIDAASRTGGARVIADVPSAPLSGNVVFVLHGCNTALGDTNFARELYEHLATTLSNPKVFGHPNSGCASRDSSWREYSNDSPQGKRRLASLKPRYERGRCCGEPA